jgi:hypothetical protein
VNDRAANLVWAVEGTAKTFVRSLDSTFRRMGKRKWTTHLVERSKPPEKTSRNPILWRGSHCPSGTQGGRESAFDNRLAFMQAAEEIIQSHPAGLATAQQRKKPQSITAAVLDIRSSFSSKPGAMPGID